MIRRKKFNSRHDVVFKCSPTSAVAVKRRLWASFHGYFYYVYLHTEILNKYFLRRFLHDIIKQISAVSNLSFWEVGARKNGRTRSRNVKQNDTFSQGIKPIGISRPRLDSLNEFSSTIVGLNVPMLRNMICIINEAERRFLRSSGRQATRIFG